MSELFRRISLVSLIDVAKDCIPQHMKARANAKDYANHALENALNDLAARDGVKPGDARRLALSVQRETKERLGYGLPILVERDGRVHFGSGAHLPTALGLAIESQVSIPYVAPVDPERLSLSDVFKN